MGFSDWLDAAFAPDKFTPQKGLRHMKKEYNETHAEQNFDEIFLELAKEMITKEGRLLSVNEVESLAHRARIQARHLSRDRTSYTIKETSMTPQQKDESTPQTRGTLNKEIYDRLDKQLQIIKTTTNPLLSEGESGSIRTMKLKTTKENILKIIQELTTKTKAKTLSQETERALHLEITRWKELAEKIHVRLARKLSGIDFKDYITEFDKSFQNTRKTAR